MGLTICKHLCLELGGNIKAYSQHGVGSIFTFSILNQREEINETKEYFTIPVKKYYL
jgi:signal transduction histidine kinase